MRMRPPKLLLSMLVITAISGCAGMEPGEPLDSGQDAEMRGPGLFTGKSGVFNVYGDDEQDSDRQNSQITSEDLDQKIKKLEQLQKELEQLKDEMEKNVEASG